MASRSSHFAIRWVVAGASCVSLVVGALGCTADPASWLILFSGGVPPGTVSVHAEIRTGSCEGAAIFSDDIAMGERTGMTPSDLADGTYYFYAEARSASCSALATGCTVVTAPITTESITVTLSPVSMPPRCEASMCNTGVCGRRDAGIDGGAPDLGIDAGAPDLGIDAGAADLGIDGGALPRFTDLGDRTVRDNNGSGLVWQQGFSLGTQNQAASITYCTTLTLDGGGWRLPTLAELLSIVDLMRVSPVIDTSFFPATPPTGGFWSSSPLDALTTHGWTVSFFDGMQYANLLTIANHARCVR